MQVALRLGHSGNVEKTLLIHHLFVYIYINKSDTRSPFLYWHWERPGQAQTATTNE